MMKKELIVLSAICFGLAAVLFLLGQNVIAFSVASTRFTVYPSIALLGSSILLAVKARRKS